MINDIIITNPLLECVIKLFFGLNVYVPPMMQYVRGAIQLIERQHQPACNYEGHGVGLIMFESYLVTCVRHQSILIKTAITNS